MQETLIRKNWCSSFSRKTVLFYNIHLKFRGGKIRPAPQRCGGKEGKFMKATNLQDLFLNVLRRDRIPVTVYLLSGYQMRGTVRGFDNFVIMLDCDGKQSMVYKHAVSTITPTKCVNLQQDGENNG